MLKQIPKTFLDTQDVTWVAPGDSVPFMQGAALNRLNSEYPIKAPTRSGWFLYSPRFMDDYDLPQGCYYLIERKTKLDNGDMVSALVAFKENGDSIEGAALFI